MAGISSLPYHLELSRYPYVCKKMSLLSHSTPNRKMRATIYQPPGIDAVMPHQILKNMHLCVRVQLLCTQKGKIAVVVENRVANQKEDEAIPTFVHHQLT